MGEPKRKNSKQRSRKRSGSKKFQAGQLSTDPNDGTLFRPHRVNPANGMYRGKQVLNLSE
ncbi:MAG: 50S ribosomal protein L32 [Verrucomicrobiota bacterium]|nr:50S ribosomal protein L32 [Verrucomicrobiota bacterium]